MSRRFVPWIVGFGVVLNLSNCAKDHERSIATQTAYMKSIKVATKVPTPEPSPFLRTPIPSVKPLETSQISSHLPPDLKGENRQQVMRIMTALPANRRRNIRWTTDTRGQFVVFEEPREGDCSPDLVFTESDRDIRLGNTNVLYCTSSGEAVPYPP